MKTALLLWLFVLTSLHAKVEIERLPERGVQPQVALTHEGLVHLVYPTGEPHAAISGIPSGD